MYQPEMQRAHSEVGDEADLYLVFRGWADLLK